MNEGIEQLSWFDRDLDDFDIDLGEENNDGQHEEQPPERCRCRFYPITRRQNFRLVKLKQIADDILNCV